VGTYKQIIDYKVSFYDLTAMSVVPNIDFTQEIDNEAILKSYYSTLKKLENMNLKSEFHKLIHEAWLVGAAFAVTWESDEPDSFICLLMDPQYCKISSVNLDSTFNFAFDMSYFTSHSEELEFMSDVFGSMYEAYRKDNSLKWQEVPSDRSIVLCINDGDPTQILPPLTPIFEDLCDLSDLRSIQATRDELSIYKLLVARMETISSTDLPDDWTVSPEIAIEYYNKMVENLDERIGAAISPLKIDVIDFDTDDTSETNKIANSIKNVLVSSGGAQTLMSSEISGATAYRNAMIADQEAALKPLLWQIERYLNRHMRDTVDNPSRVVMMKTSPWFKEEYKDSLLKSAQYGVPTKLAISTLDGFSPLETLSLEYLENDILKLHENWIPLQSSFTQTDSDTDPLTGGRPTSDDTLSDEGENTKDKK
jgi:hypothetical protein